MTKRQELTAALQKFYQKPIAKVSLELFLSIGAVVFFALFAIRPTLLTMSDLIKELEDKRELDQQLAQKIAALSSAQNTYLQIEDRLGVLDEAIPLQPKLNEVILILEKIASEQGLVIENMTVTEIPEENIADINRPTIERVSMPVTISLTGDYLSIRNYIETLLSLRRSFVVDTIIFSKTVTRGKDSLRATITLGVPYFSDGTSGTINNREP